MLLGEQDDNLPVAKVEGYLAYASGAGHPAPITTVVYPGAFHAWTVPPGRPALLRAVREHAEVPVHPVRPRGAHRARGRARAAFDPDALAACRAAGPGYSMASDANTRTKSTADTVAFLQRHLGH